MADKQINYPSGLVPSWANDVNISDPGEPWDATPSKVEPGAATRDTGFVPADKPAAQHVNFMLNNYAKWLQYFGDVGHLNWRSEDVGTLTQALGCCYDRGNDTWTIGGEAGKLMTSFAGGTWALSTAPTVVALSQLATKDPTDAPTHTGQAVLAVADTSAALQLKTSGGWNSQSPGSYASSTCAIWEPTGAKWIVGGQDGSSHARFVIASHAATPAWSVITPPTAAGGQVRSIAHNGAGLIVAVGSGVGDAWTSTNGGASWTYRATGSTTSHQTVAYDSALGLFVALAGAEVLTTADGVLWTTVASLAKSFAKSGTASRGHSLLQIVGNLWIAAGDTGSVILASTDRGIAWREIPIDLAASPPLSMAYSERHRRFLAVGAIADARAAFSLAVGTPDTTTEGRSAPQV